MKELKYLKIVMPLLDKDMQKFAQHLAAGKITIDLYELESMVNPDKFEFPEENIGAVGVDLNEESI